LILVTLSRDADADLAGILDYSIGAHGVAIAEEYLRTIHGTLSRLSDFPELGVSRTDLAAGIRSLPTGEHRAFYKITSEGVLVVRVLHKAMDSTRHL
jgi:toxin ParE1/3/4